MTKYVPSSNNLHQLAGCRHKKRIMQKMKMMVKRKHTTDTEAMIINI